MTRPPLLVVKVGGSLLDWPELRTRLVAFLDSRHRLDETERTILIAGGGPVAEFVRGLDRAHRLGDPTAHRLAIEAMDFTSKVLAAVVPGAVAVDRIDAPYSAWKSGKVPVLAPGLSLSEIEQSALDPLPESWDVTSDTISARIAAHWNAASLILLKSTALPRSATREDAVRLGLVDPMFPQFARKLPFVGYLNLRDPAAELVPF